MARSENTSLVIADPGLESPAGHHAGTAINMSMARLSADSIIFFAHKNIDDGLCMALKDSGCEVHRHFTTSQYQYYGERSYSSIDLHPYIQGLSKEYHDLFGQLAARNEDEQFVVCYHTLSWEHAGALALALGRNTTFSGRLKHIVMLMFNPGIDFTGEMTDARQCLNFRTAMNVLRRCRNVELFAGDTELAFEYQQLMRLPQPLPVHPCFLADWDKLTRKDLKSAVEFFLVTLYLGDAKIEKGFCKLPGLLKELLSHTDSQIKFLIQYTFNDEDPRIRDIVEALEKIADEDERLILHFGFWDDHQLHDALRRTDLTVLNYDGTAYRDKSSGILWLLGWYQSPLLFFEHSWLVREAERLGLPFKVLPDNMYLPNEAAQEITQLLDKYGKKSVSLSMDETIKNYRNKIYSNFYDWIMEKAEKWSEHR